MSLVIFSIFNSKFRLKHDTIGKFRKATIVALTKSQIHELIVNPLWPRGLSQKGLNLPPM